MYNTLLRDYVSKITYGINNKHEHEVLNDWCVGMNKLILSFALVNFLMHLSPCY